MEDVNKKRADLSEGFPRVLHTLMLFLAPLTFLDIDSSIPLNMTFRQMFNFTTEEELVIKTKKMKIEVK